MQYTAKIAEGGRVVIPARVRKALDLKIGDDILIDVKDNVIQLRSPEAAWKKLQDKVKARMTEDSFSSDDLIAERRAEARAENEGT